MSTAHDCNDHGHYCSICEDARIAREEEARIASIVDSWNWNASIFDIYDELKEDHGDDEEFQEKLLTKAYEFFLEEDTRKMLDELAYHMFGHNLVVEKVEVGT